MSNPGFGAHALARGLPRPTTLRAAALAACVLAGCGLAKATPLDFTLANINASTQSRLNLAATAQLAGAALVSGPQVAPGGTNGLGSLSTLYNDIGNGSRLAADVTQQSISLQDTGGAIARNAAGSLGNNLAIAPGVGGASGTAPASYGVKFTAAQNIPVPPIDLTPFGVTGTLNLGTLTSVDTKVALRGVVVDVVSAPIALSPYGFNPQTFDAALLQVGISGTADVLFGATARQDTATDYIAAGLALAALQSALAPQGVNLTVVNNGFIARSYTIGFALSTPLPENLVANEDASLARLEQSGSNLRLTVPVNFTFAPSTAANVLFTAQYGLSGTLIGQVPFTVVEVPEPGALWLGLLGLAVIGSAQARRRASSHGRHG